MIKYFLISILSLMVWETQAAVTWSEPEVVPEKLVRKNRRVLRFTGQTEPGARVRIRNNKIKLYLETGGTRWARIPQKHTVQFPLTVDSSGFFTFDLYLPTVAVEIPIQVMENKVWKTTNLNFRVPDSGKANDFAAMEESFKDHGDQGGMTGIEKDDNYYSSKRDQGQIIQDRLGKKGYDDSRFKVWGGIGISYFSNSVSHSGVGFPNGGISTSGSSLVLPAFAGGFDWDYSPKFLVQGAIRSVSGSTDDIGSGLVVTGNNFSWLQGQANVVWFSDHLKMSKGRLGLDVGFQLQSLPFFKERQGQAALTYFDNSVYNFHVGLMYQKKNNKIWNYEFYGRYLYPIMTGDAFDLDSSFPMMFEFGGGLKRPLTKGLGLGIFSQVNYFSSDAKYTDPVAGPRQSSFDLMLITVEARLIGSF